MVNGVGGGLLRDVVVREVPGLLRPGQLVTLFLLPRMIEELLPKFRRDLQPGARIVSHQFDLGPSWPPEQSRDVSGLMIHLWTIR